jgi:cytidine deaminase
MSITNNDLVKLAFSAMKNSYSPYSHCKVGSALLSKNGKVYLGCNVENASYGVTNCAERTAFFNAVSEGEREFSKIAIVGGVEGKVKDLFMPCGVCRQVMAEFCSGDFEVLVASSQDDFKVFKLRDLLPHSFDEKNLSNGE